MPNGPSPDPRSGSVEERQQLEQGLAVRLYVCMCVVELVSGHDAGVAWQVDVTTVWPINIATTFVKRRIIGSWKKICLKAKRECPIKRAATKLIFKCI